MTKMKNEIGSCGSCAQHLLWSTIVLTLALRAVAARGILTISRAIAGFGGPGSRLIFSFIFMFGFFVFRFDFSFKIAFGIGA